MYIGKYRRIFLSISVSLMILSLGVILFLGLRPGIDFTGGALTEVVYDERKEKVVLESELSAVSDLGGFSLRDSSDIEGRTGYILRTRDLTEEERKEVETVLLQNASGGEIIRFTSIGPVIGEELKDKAIWAVGGVVLIIVLYVAFAFSGVRKPVGSFVYGGITIFALIHDVLVPTALVSLLGYFLGVEVDILFIMALLAVLGYSVNDTIVIFDRVRENLVKYRLEKRQKVNIPGGVREEVTYTFTKPFEEIVGLSVGETMVRSINTSLTTLLALTALYVFGGEATKIFALVLIAGVIAGTYSSIFLANPLLITVAKWQEGKDARSNSL